MTDANQTHPGERPRRHVRGRGWTRTDRTGGLIDDVFDRLRTERPNLVVQRLECTHPGDDDNVYWLWDGGSDNGDDIQIDTNVDGRPPILIEDDAGHRYDLDSPDVDDVVGIVRRMLDDIDKRQEPNRQIT